jgi:hypothetical protein
MGALAALSVPVKFCFASENGVAIEASPIRRRLGRELSVSPFLDVLFRPCPQVFAAAQNRSPADVGFYRIRPTLKPVTLGELASLNQAL